MLLSQRKNLKRYERARAKRAAAKEDFGPTMDEVWFELTDGGYFSDEYYDAFDWDAGLTADACWLDERLY